MSAQARQPPLVASAKSSGKTSFEELGRWRSSNTSVCTWQVRPVLGQRLRELDAVP